MTEPGKGLEWQKNQKNQSPQGKNYLLAIAIKISLCGQCLQSQQAAFLILNVN